MAICPYCGSQIGDQAEICGFCGGKLTPAPAAKPEELLREIPEAETESEYEGIPDDILGSVLGSLGIRSVPAEPVPPVPAAEIPEIPTVDELFDVPPAAEVPEAPAVEEVPTVEAAPVIEEVPAEEAPAVEEVPVVPAAAEIPARDDDVQYSIKTPVVPVAPEILAAQPVYAQPVYAQPAEKKPAPKWVLPAVILAVLALIGILFFATRGGGKANDPNLGVYKAATVEMYGMQLNADDIYQNGFTIELKSNGVCEINSDGQKGRGKWTLEGDVITIDDNHSVITGTLSDGVLTLENMLDMGLNMTMEKQES